MNFRSPLLGRSAQCVLRSSLMSSSSMSPPCGMTRICGSQHSSSGLMRMVADMRPSEFSVAWPMFPVPSTLPNDALFCASRPSLLSRSDRSCAVLVIGPHLPDPNCDTCIESARNAHANSGDTSWSPEMRNRISPTLRRAISTDKGSPLVAPPLPFVERELPFVRGRGPREVEAVEVHDLVPRGHEVAHELRLRVVGRVDLR